MSYQLINLPKPPDDIIKLCIDVLETEPFYNVNPYDKVSFMESCGYGKTVDLTSSENFTFHTTEEAFAYLEEVRDLYKPAHIILYTAPQPVIDWINENIKPLMQHKYNLADVPELVRLDHGNMALPHTDPAPPKLNLNLILLTGGDNVVTKFFEPKPEYKGKPFIPAFPYKDEVMDYVSEIKIEQNSWGILIRDSLHSVCNLTGTRLILQLGMTPK